MKKTMKASGIATVLSLLGVAAMTGCGADVGDQGAAGDRADIGESAQALITNGQPLEFGGSIALDSTIKNSAGTTGNLVLWAGGMDDTGGGLSKKIGYYDRQSDTYFVLKTTGNLTQDLELTSALVEPVISKVPNETQFYVIAGGRTAKDGAATTQSYVLKIDVDVNGKIASGQFIATPAMNQARVIGERNLPQCGTGKKLIAFGGATTKGFMDPASRNATTSVEVLTLDPNGDGSFADAAWSTLKDNSGSSNVVTLPTATAYPQVFDADPTNHQTFYVAGGWTPGLLATDDTLKLSVTTGCVSTNDGAGNTLVALTGSGIMPDVRARAASIAVTTDSISGVVYDFALAGGNDASVARPRDVFVFDVGTEAWLNLTTLSSTNKIQEGKVFPRFLRGTGGVRLVSGIKPLNTNQTTQTNNPYYDTSVTVDLFTENTHTWSTGTALSTSRWGVFVESIHDGSLANNPLVDLVGFGNTHAATGGSPTSTASSTPNDVVTF